MANNTGTFFNVNDNDGIPLVGVSTNGKVMINHLYGNCLIGSTSVTGTADQKLQVTGGAYVSGNLGIGTAIPVKKLHVQTGIVSAAPRGGGFTQVLFESNQATASYWEFQANASSTNDILFSKSSVVGSSYGIVGYDHATDALRFYTNGGEKVRIDGAGNVLVGTATSTGTASQKLQVTGGAYVSDSVGIGITNTAYKLHTVQNNNDIGLSTGSIPVSPGIVLQNSGGDVALWLGNDNRVSAGLGTLANNGSVIDLSGKYSSTNTYASLTFGRIGAFKENNTSGDFSGYLSLYSRSAVGGNLLEALRIDSSQRVGIGTTNPARKLDVVDSGASGSVIRSKVTTNNGGYLAYEALNSSGTSVFSVTHNGRINLSENVVFASGQGLDFSATANSSGTMSSELLSDYEEGTWTPTLSVGTLTSSIGTYTRVGRLVTIYFQISGFSNITSTNAVTVTGIPFTTTSSTAVGHIFGRFINNGTGGAFTTLYIASNGLQIYNISTGAYDFLNYNEINNGASCEIYGVATYQVT